MDQINPPEHLEGEALLEWGRITDELRAQGLLESADRAVITLHCRTWATWREADKLVDKFGSVFKYSGNPGAAPYFKTAMEAAKLDRQLLADLGLNPSTRFKRKPKDETADADKGDEF